MSQLPGDERLEEALNSYGQDGWDVVAASGLVGLKTPGAVIILKKEMTDPNKPA